MRKLFSVLVFTSMISFESFSQIERGNFLVGGVMNFQYSNDDNISVYAVSIDPQLSYFVIDKLAIGIVTPNSFGGINAPRSKKLSFQNYGIGPTARYYISINSKWAVFPTINYTWSWYSDNGLISSMFRATDPNDPLLNSSGSISTTSKSLVAGIGGTYFITTNLGLEGILSYQKYETAGDGIILGNTHNEVINLKIGVQIYLIAKKNRMYNIE